MSTEKENKENRSTDISKHKRDGSTLKPPFRQLSNMNPSSWKDERLPEMLWAVLLIGNLKREEALTIFRKVAAFVSSNPALLDVTHSGIATWTKESRLNFANLLKESHPAAKKLLQSLIIFSQLPGFEEWAEVFGRPNDESTVTEYISNGIVKTIWHQSEEATDCRWIKFLCEIHGGKIRFASSMQETLKGVFEYPNYGDLRHVRPFIRASEIGMDMRGGGKTSNWSNDFWKACLEHTICMPMPREKQKMDEINVNHEQVNKIRHLLLLHYLKTDESTDIEAKHDTIFGFGFYVLRLLDELLATNLSRGAIGRIVLRSCVECYITLSYLINKDDQSLWDNYRNYGIGQMKLSYLKTRDLKTKPSFIDEEFLKQIANEDRWEEFADIELSHWASSDLRKMSEEAGCKEFYDAYYGWTSSFSHGNWGAFRESCFTMCANPLHRLHLIPSVSIYPLPGVLEDVVKVTNLILNLVDSQYSDLKCEIINEPKTKKVFWLKRFYYKIRYHRSQKFIDQITGRYFQKKSLNKK